MSAEVMTGRVELKNGHIEPVHLPVGVDILYFNPLNFEQQVGQIIQVITSGHRSVYEVLTPDGNTDFAYSTHSYSMI